MTGPARQLSEFEAAPSAEERSPLIAEMQAGDPARIAAFRRQVFPWLTALCARVLGDRSRAEELAEDVWTDFIVLHLPRVRSEDGIAAYLRVMAVRRCARLRQRQQEHQQLADPAAPPSAEADPLAKARLERCLGRLTPRVIRLLRLRFQHDLTQEAIGRALGTSRQYVAKVMDKSLQSLRRCLEDSP